MGKERITVPAGTFDCWKVSETVEYTMRGKSQAHFTRLTWYADGIGEVRSEDLDDAGDVIREVELVSVIYSCGI